MGDYVIGEGEECRQGREAFMPLKKYSRHPRVCVCVCARTLCMCTQTCIFMHVCLRVRVCVCSAQAESSQWTAVVITYCSYSSKLSLRS